jgi:hypothetical protein
MGYKTYKIFFLLMLDKITKDFISKLVIEINKPENKIIIENDVIAPIFSNFADRIYPYVSLLFIMYSLNLVLIIVILFLIIIYKNKLK